MQFGTKTILLDIDDGELAEFVLHEYVLNIKPIPARRHKLQVCVISGTYETKYLVLEGGRLIRKIKRDVNVSVNIKEFILQGLIELCLSKNGFYFMHASSYMIDKNLFVFLGPSGSGKTTILQLLKPKNVTSNDTLVLQRSGKGVIFLYTSPFDGNSSVTQTKKIKIKNIQFYKLTKNKINVISKLELHEKVELLITNMNLHMFAMQTNIASISTLKTTCQIQAAKTALDLQNSSEAHNLNFNLGLNNAIFSNITQHE